MQKLGVTRADLIAAINIAQKEAKDIFEKMLADAKAALTNYRAGLGSRYDKLWHAEKQDVSAIMHHVIPFGLSEVPDQLFASMANDDNTKVKIFAMVEVGEIDMTDESLNF